MAFRKEKLEELIRRLVSEVLIKEINDPRIGFVTITGVEISDDLRYAKVFFSVLGKEEDKKKTREALDSALGFIRTLVAERIQLRFAPEIVFREDNSSEYSNHIQKLLDDIKELDGPKKGEDK